MTFAQFATGIVSGINTILVPIVFTLSFAAFVWGIVNYFFLHGNENGKRAQGRAFAIWGVIGMAVLLSVWGLVSILLSTLGFSPSA